MAKANPLQNITDKAAEFLAVAVKTIKKMDRRLLIMIGAAAVLVIIIFSLIIHGISSGKKEGEVIESNNSISNMQELPSEVSSEKAETSGNLYRVSTGSDAPLNMRLAADRDSNLTRPGN